MAETNIQKVYTLSIVGGEKSVNQVEQLNTAFNKLRETKESLNGQLENAILSKEGASNIQKLRAQITDLNKQMAGLNNQRQKATNDAKAQAQAEKLLADIKLKEAQATAALARADKERTASIIAQEKELDRQIDRETKLEAQLRKQKQAVDSLPGSYNALKKELRELDTLVKAASSGSPVTFQGNTLSYDQAIGKLKELSSAEQEFRRQFAKDQTLVGEYTTGILQAFNKAGLNDLINNQINNANTKIKDLDKSFEALTAQYAQIRTEGSGAFDAVEKEMIQNRQEAEKLRNEVAGINTRLGEVNGVGDKVTKALKDGFRDAAKQITTYAIGLIGIQNLINVVSNEFREGIGDAKKIEGVEAAFNRLNDPNLLSRLREATKGTVSDLELMQRAVEANNFEIPLNTLGNLLDFARKRAKDTGQEVNFLVDSIIKGIGRKSPLILDNLGISAVRLKENLGGVAAESASIGDVAQAVSKIIQEENAKSGLDIDTTTESIAQQKAAWENIRTELSRNLLPVLSALGTIGVSIASFLAGIPFPVIVAGIGSVTAALALYKAEQIRAYVVAQLATKQGLIYNAVLLAQRAGMIAYTLAVRAATYQVNLFNTGIRFSPFGAILTVLALLVPAIAAFAQEAKKAKEEIDALTEIQTASNAIASEQIGRINALKAVIESSVTSYKSKWKAMDDLIALNPAFEKAIDGEIINIKKLKAAYDEVTSSIRLKAKVEASAKLTAERQAAVNEVSILKERISQAVATGNSAELKKLSLGEVLPKESQLRKIGGNVNIGGINYDLDVLLRELTKEEFERIKKLQSYQDIANRTQEQLDKTINPKGINFEVNIEALKSKLDGLTQQRDKFAGAKKELIALNTEIKNTEEELNKLMGKNSGGSPSTKGSSLSGQQKDGFKEIEAVYDKQIADEKRRVAEIQKTRELSFDEEVQYLQNINKLETEFLNAKLGRLTGKNAEEKKQIADFNLEKVNLELSLQKDIKAIKEKEFSKQNEILKKEFESLQSQETLKLSKADEDGTGNEFTRAQAKISFYETILEAQKMFNSEQVLLEKNLGIESQVNAEERAKALTDIETNLSKARVDAVKVGLQQNLKTVEDATQITLNQIKQDVTDATIAILNNPNLSNRQKGKEIGKLERDQQKNVLDKEIEGLQKSLDAKKALLDRGLLTEQQYSDAKTALKLKELELVRLVGNEELSILEKIGKQIGATINGMLGLRDFATEQEKVDSALQTTAGIIQNTIQMAYQGWIDKQKQSIENELKGQIQIQEAEKQRVLGTAQSAEERAIIEQRFNTQREALERAAGEKKKKLALKEAAINYGVAVLKTMMQYGYPIGLIPVAGLTVQYLLQRSQINAQQFAEGGQVQPAALSDGKITTPSNITTQPNGDSVLATVKPGEVILNRAQQIALGGHKTFRSIGVPGFASGGIVSGSRFDNLLNGGTPPPVVDSINGRLAFGDQMNMSESKAMIDSLAEIVNRQNGQIGAMRQTIEKMSRIPVVASDVQAKNNARKLSSDYGSF
jgi:hypothetical protein